MKWLIGGILAVALIMIATLPFAVASLEDGIRGELQQAQSLAAGNGVEVLALRAELAGVKAELEASHAKQLHLEKQYRECAGLGAFSEVEEIQK